MNFLFRIVRAVLVPFAFGAAAFFSLATSPAHPGEPPTDSIYRLDVPLVDQDGKGLHLADARGKPRIIGMFYTSCHSVCPLLVDTLLATERALAPDTRAGLGVLLVSFDSARDDPAALKRIADLRRLDTTRWTLARTEPANVRKLAALLGIQYRRLDDGEFNHSSALILLDAEGRIVARTETIGTTDPAFIDAVEKTLAAK